MLPELGPGQQRAITYLWAATQVAAAVVRDAFIEIYTSLPDSGGGHTSIKEYCRLAGRSGVYLELLDEGYLSSNLAGSPRDAAFLDLKVTRKILEKVLAEKFGRGSFGKLVFEVRQLVYLRNDLCHQLLPSLPADQYLACMQQLETRLCTVTRLAALIAGAAIPPHATLNHIHVLFVSFLNPDDDLILNSISRRSRTDNGTQAGLHQATEEKGVQVDTITRHNNPPAAPTREMEYLQRQTEGGTSENVKYDHESAKLSGDSPDPGTWRGLRGGVVTHVIDGTRQGSRYRDAGCRVSRRSKNHLHHRVNDTPAKGNKKLGCHSTETRQAGDPYFFPGPSLLRDKPYRGGVMTRDPHSSHTSGHGFAKLVYTDMTVKHVIYTTPYKDSSVAFILLMVLLSLCKEVFILLRLAACSIYYMCVQAKRVCKHSLESLCFREGKREAQFMTGVVLIPCVVHEELCDWKAGCRRKKRKNTRMIN